jgi:fumarate hydratase subunit alpha
VRRLDVSRIAEAVRRGVREANTRLPIPVKGWMRNARKSESSSQAKAAFDCLIENSLTAERTGLPLCQDTGLTVVLLDIGQEVLLTGGPLRAAVDKGVARGTREAFLRRSVVADPLRRNNTGTNTPAVIHTAIVPGSKVRITVMPKGGGAENMSFLRMLSPSVSREEIESIVVEGVRKAGTNPCPPVVVGIGLGGNFELCGMLAKKALLKTAPNKDRYYKAMESSILKAVNRLGIGPQVPSGGKITALAVRIETAPCHIASLPLAVNINCHSHRWWRAEL